MIGFEILNAAWAGIGPLVGVPESQGPMPDAPSPEVGRLHENMTIEIVELLAVHSINILKCIYAQLAS